MPKTKPMQFVEREPASNKPPMGKVENMSPKKAVKSATNKKSVKKGKK